VLFVLCGRCASRTFAVTNPEYSVGAYAGRGVATEGGVFASRLACELSHALGAHRNRVRVDGITSRPFGGVLGVRPPVGSSGLCPAGLRVGC
jgi:hypothetical protein